MKRCPFCDSINIRSAGYDADGGRLYWEDEEGKYTHGYWCKDCGKTFRGPSEDVNDNGECPSCMSTNTVYYTRAEKHWYCNDCGTRW